LGGFFNADPAFNADPDLRKVLVVQNVGSGIPNRIFPLKFEHLIERSHPKTVDLRILRIPYCVICMVWYVSIVHCGIFVSKGFGCKYILLTTAEG
jgi:hypothetical protein